MASDFTYFQPVKVFFGDGKLASLGEVLGELGLSSAIIVCGPHFERNAEKIMAECSAVKAVWAGVEPNPQLSGAETAARLAREHKAEAIIGVGGGSSIDTAKFASAVALGDGCAQDYYNGRPFPEKRLAVIAVPTTAGTGSEVTQVSVMNNGEEKRTINNPAFMPRAAIVDSSLMLSVPPRTTMMTGLDALSHALEGYWSIHHQPITDLYSAEAVRVILNNLQAAFENGGNAEARSNMAYAALAAGMAFAQSKTAGCHACSYPLSMNWHLPHGEACAFTLPSFVRVNRDERLDELARRAGLRDSEELAVRIEELRAMAGLRTRLSELGDVDAEKLAAECAEHPLMRNNPVEMTPEKLAELFRALA